MKSDFEISRYPKAGHVPRWMLPSTVLEEQGRW